MAVAPVNLRDWAHTAAQRGWGAGWPSCSGAAGNLATVTFARSKVRVTVHKRLARLVQILADETERRGYLAKSGQTGAYNCRAIAGTKTPSNHSWGLAVDWNWQDNPYSTNPKHTNPQWMYDLWARYGFANGSMYSGAKDWMHLEQMGSPAQVDALTALAITEILGQPVTPAPSPPLVEDDMFTDADRKVLNENNRILRDIWQQLVGPGAGPGEFTGWPAFKDGTPELKATLVDYARHGDEVLAKLITALTNAQSGKQP